jgi:ABC-type nickel/cobalt efflux system permease component RcnA
MKRHLLLALFLVTGTLFAHPMGNFSVSHYSRIQVTASGAEIHYVLDLAEIPTFELLQEWGLTAGSPQTDLNRKSAGKALEWVHNLQIVANGREIQPQLVRTSAVLDKGALSFEDGNYPERAGWKEIVVTAGKDAVVEDASPSGADRSHELQAYPQDPLVAPPQNLRAAVRWHAAAPLVSQTVPPQPEPTRAVPPSQPESNVQPGQSAPGMVVRGDYLSRLLRQTNLGWGAILIGLAVAFGLGSIHALSPGHGKTIVAAYLVGSRGTAKHAAFLGGMVTFTHTISVFFLGLVTLFLSRYVLPETIYPVLGTISGLSIVWIGGTLFYRRYRKAFGHVHVHEHHHGHDHHHDHGAFTHDHGDGHVHSHVPEGEITLTSLVALGASGGLVPCPSALVLLLSSVALGRVGLGLILLVAFSAGLAAVLTAIGMTVVYAKNLLPDSQKTARNAAFRYLPVASAAIITCAGVLMTAVALGVIRPFAGI